ncbi:Protein C32D5.3 [Aphelenchoides avenae]|nr:Protein C32D5.3 [Aphelenchus avenae]
MDQLLKSCHGSPSLNQFTESYLKMVQKLLETNDPQMERMATDLFCAFSTIEENAPSYHRQYDFFISKFSSVCHASKGEYAVQRRYDGLRGLRGVIWKSAGDDLNANIWERQHMDKIVPSILFNLQDDGDELQEYAEKTSTSTYHYTREGSEDEPHGLAIQCLRELFGKCSFGSLRSVLEPVLKHCDLHHKWEPPATFAISTFKAILYSIQTQNSYFVLQELINHLEHMSASDASVRIGIATVLSSVVSIAGTTMGPLLLGIFNSLLKQLRGSVEFQQSRQCPDANAEKIFQETLINAMGDFANALPDYQKVEIMMFTMGNIPTISEDERTMKTSDAILQKVLVKTLLKIATKYKTFYFATVFTDSFLKTLLQLALTPDAEVRLTVQQIFHTLLDRHDNLDKLAHLQYVREVSDLQLTIEKCSRQDQLFMRRHIQAITSVLYRIVLVAEEDHCEEHLDAVLCSMTLICVEIGNDENLAELFRLAFGLQTLALDPDFSCGLRKRATIHNLVAKYLNLSSQLLAIPALCRHIEKVIELRAQKAHSRLNIMAHAYPPADPLVNTSGRTKAPIAVMDSEDDLTARLTGIEDEPDLLFDIEHVAEALKASNKEAQRLLVPFKPSASLNLTQLTTTDSTMFHTSGQRSSNLATTVTEDDISMSFPDAVQFNNSNDDGTISIDTSSIDWSPPESKAMSRRNTVFGTTENREMALLTTVESLRAVIHAPPDVSEEERKDQEMSMNVLKMFRNKNVEELSAFLAREDEEDDLSKKIQRLIKRNADRTKVREFGHNGGIKNISELELPAFFVR